VRYPLYLLNGRPPGAPGTLSARPRERVRLRIVNAAADTAFQVALGGHRLTVTHTDGFPVTPVTGDALLVGMGERYDALVELDDGVFPLVALAGARTPGRPRSSGPAAARPPGRMRARPSWRGGGSPRPACARRPASTWEPASRPAPTG
jgi:FtsP/CotA-like multicopper oxidase with cupredoxin domain